MTTTTTRGTSPHPYVTSYEPAANHPLGMRIGNAFMRWVLKTRLGEKMQGLSLLTVTGRKTGKRYVVPVSVLDLDGTETILTAAGWRVNLRGGADVEVRAGRTIRRMRATLIEDPERIADVYERQLRDIGVAHAKRLGLVLAGDRYPTREELIEAIRGHRSLITLE